MNAVNRILVVLWLLIALPLGVAILIAPIPVLGALGQGLDSLISWLDTTPALARISLGILFALAWIIICILLLILELRRPPRRMVRVQRVDGGVVEVSLSTVKEHVAYELEQLPGVLRAHPRASARRNEVFVEVDVDIASNVEVPTQAAQLVEVIRKAVEERVGVRLAQPPRVHLRAAPAPSIVRRPAGGSSLFQ